MATKVRATRVSKEALKANRIMSYVESCDGDCNISPINIRNTGSYGVHVAEDAKGDVFLITDDEVMLMKLRDRNLGVSTTNYMLDGVGKAEIKAAQIVVDTVEEVVVESVVEEVPETIEETQGEENE